jgi:hypothetical protein
MKPGIYKNNSRSAFLVQKVDVNDLTKYGVSQNFINSLIKDKKTNTFLAGFVEADDDINKMCSYITNKDDNIIWFRLLFNTGHDDNYSTLFGLSVNGDPVSWYDIDIDNNHVYIDSTKSIFFRKNNLGDYFGPC